MAINEEGAQEMFSIEDYLLNSVGFDIPAEAIRPILADREVLEGSLYAEVDKKTRDLCKADLYKWICTNPNKKTAVSDSDNGWSHSDGGYTLSEYDKSLFRSMANAIYSEYEEPTFGRATVRINSYGVKRADRTIDGEHLPHVIR